jgi:hypothetical protein
VDDADRRLQMSLSRRVLIWNEGRPPDFESFGKARPPLFDFRLERAALLLQVILLGGSPSASLTSV